MTSPMEQSEEYTVNSSQVRCKTTAINIVPDVRCVGLHCCVARLHFE